MRVVHVLRKPLSEPTVAENVLKHGTGGLNIDGTRIGIPPGRWPTNLILQHLPGCQQTGIRRVPGTSIHGERTATRRSGAHTEAGGHQTIGRVQPVRGHAEPDGMETITAWDCEPDCPVANLDSTEYPSEAGPVSISRFFKQVKP